MRDKLPVIVMAIISVLIIGISSAVILSKKPDLTHIDSQETTSSDAEAATGDAVSVEDATTEDVTATGDAIDVQSTEESKVPGISGDVEVANGLNIFGDKVDIDAEVKADTSSDTTDDSSEDESLDEYERNEGIDDEDGDGIDDRFNSNNGGL